VESELLGRFDEALAMSSSIGDGVGEECSNELDRAGEVGPEYIVRGDRRHSVFEAQVRRAIQEIEEGGLAKVVLARSLSIDHDAPIDVPAFLARLRDLYPSCTLVAIGRGKDTFLAATPERLVRVSGFEVESAALAGSTPRGRHPEEDQAFAAALLGSEKENEEHAYVVASIRGVIEEVCDDFECSATPELRRLVGIQHLQTRLRGRLRQGPDGKKVVDVLGLVEALHPTPAVGGVPATQAMGWLKRFEGLDRGWYASPIGWLDEYGGGDFRVALRSALIRNGLAPAGESGASHAILFAGAGIVAASEPARELVETRIKLRALLAPMTEI
jgi:isochorismate synthase